MRVTCCLPRRLLPLWQLASAWRSNAEHRNNLANSVLTTVLVRMSVTKSRYLRQWRIPVVFSVFYLKRAGLPGINTDNTDIDAGHVSHSKQEHRMSVYEKLKALNIELPAVAAPAAAYVMYAQAGNTVFLSGHLAKKDGKVWVGQFGKNITTEEGKLAARAVAIDLLATLQAACGGDLTRVKRIVKLMSLVNSTGDFTEQHLVTNGASELIGELFGEQGKHARSAFGVAQIPMGACVEIELIAELS